MTATGMFLGNLQVGYTEELQEEPWSQASTDNMSGCSRVAGLGVGYSPQVGWGEFFLSFTNRSHHASIALGRACSIVHPRVYSSQPYACCRIGLYRSSNPAYKPSSDTPLLIACLSGSSAARHHWGSQPRVALHGHALAEGAGGWQCTRSAAGVVESGSSTRWKGAEAVAPGWCCTGMH